ncbi:SusC/RagA family TonB-linked outer membrane protein [Flexithrix dorotheae]|uniref:SusC/RagA family TonB-linked outer membrane protein n=1 Tax=Flexithrix dorotheae TaxID=70993 RepID=UPI001FE132A6|nr:TonB-dependent receptor [Flexithrix dorotheae]
MKLKIIRQIIMMSKYAIIGIFLQSLLGSLLMAREGKAQNSLEEIYVSINLQSANLEETFTKVENQTGFNFSYRRNLLQNAEMININSEHVSVADLLKMISKKTGLRFKRVDNTIHVKDVGILKKAPKNFIDIDINQIKVGGKITSSEDGEPLPGVSVLIKGTTTGTTSDMDGNYSLAVPEGSSLKFSYIGFTSQEIVVGTQSEINIVLEQDLEQLEEVIVVGYGTQKKVNLTGAVDVASGEKLESRPIISVGQGLQGLIPNLNITVPNGDPSQGAQFNIRGYESINGGAPLILVDNVPMDINRINPEDIKNITVLKDGAASAIYGARAAFGVVLVETKQGKKGINVSVGSQFSWNKPIWHVEPYTNGYEYALDRNLVQEREGQNPYYGEDYMIRLKQYWDDPANNDPYAVVDGRFEQYGLTGVNTELLDNVSPRQKYDVSISGASDKANYYTSFGYLNTDGYLNSEGNDNFKRYNILLKGDFQVADWFAINQQVTVNIQKSDKPSQSSINDLIRTEPIRAFVVPKIEGYEQYEGMFWDNPFTIKADLAQGGREIYTNQDLWMNTGVTLTPIKRLTVKSNFSYNIFNQNFQSSKLPYQLVSFELDQANPLFTTGDDVISIRKQYNQYYVWNNYAEYLIEDWSNHYIKAMVGYNQEWGYNSTINGSSGTVISPQITDIGATSGLQTIGGGQNRATIRGVFYRFNYIFKDRYLFETNGRYDGTSRFPQNDRFGFFPSVSVGWRISEEGFMASTRSFIDNLKIRASYGSLGNQNIRKYRSKAQDYYPYIPTMNSGFSSVILGSGQIPFINPPGLVSPTLTWEEVVTQNIGIDLALFNSKFQVSFDIYARDTKDMLLRREYPMALGTAPPAENGADLRTKGWELAIKWKDNVSTDFSYFADLNLADWTAEITKYDNPTGALSEYYVGQKLGEIWGYETVGMIQDEEQLANIPDQSRLGNNFMVGDLEFADLNNDGIISQGENTTSDPGDRKIIGNNSPRYTLGLNAGATYKSFSLSVFFQGVAKRDYYPSAGNWTWFFPWRSRNGDISWPQNSWTPENRDAYFPQMQYDAKNFVSQTRYLQNASYIRLKNITLSYNLPRDLVSKIGLSNLRAYVGAENLWEATKIRKPLDPEYVFDNSINYPLFRSYTMGLNFNF